MSSWNKVSRETFAEVEKATPQERGRLAPLAFFLMGVLHDKARSLEFSRMIDNDMMESVTYREVVTESEAKGLEKGRAEMTEVALDALLMAGTYRLGEPTAAEAKAVAAISVPDRLKELTARMKDPKVTTWSGLLGRVAPLPEEATES